MYFICDICGKFVDDGCPVDKICLECIDKIISFALVNRTTENEEKQQGN